MRTSFQYCTYFKNNSPFIQEIYVKYICKGENNIVSITLKTIALEKFSVFAVRGMGANKKM